MTIGLRFVLRSDEPDTAELTVLAPMSHARCGSAPASACLLEPATSASGCGCAPSTSERSPAGLGSAAVAMKARWATSASPKEAVGHEV